MRRTIALATATALSLSLALGPTSTAAAGGGGCAEITRAGGTTVEMALACFTPSLLRVAPGETVTFVNRDPFRHIVVGSGYRWGSPGFMGEGDAFTATFRRQGTYPFQCSLHPGMVGAVLVGDANGAGAASDGRVRVAPVPPSPSPSPVVVTETLERQVFVTEPVERAAWIVLGAGLALCALGGAALVRARRRAPAPIAMEPAAPSPALR
ncbi:MAG TPA: plastocyanin/azurin family copper-binding protein [Actinomycetota bacterium]|nr:plastocyanin/azurin family copper-binding protein [Actinomycetota bacterium]